MLTALLAGRNAVLGTHHDVWAVNTDREYLEEASRPEPRPPVGVGVARAWERQPPKA